MEPAYARLHASGELARRAREALGRLRACDLCPRSCGVDRTAGGEGECRTGRLAAISSVGPHHGEEAPLSGRRGSGTVFFSGCNLNCTYCQNFDISQLGSGREVDARGLAHAFMTVQALGCHNLNLVTPTHVTAQILEALDVAAGMGLAIPVVYNCGGYESVRTLELLDGVVDIYMPDLKYSEAGPADRYSGAPDYPEVARAALREMHRQVGDLVADGSGIATRGLLVRHLVLPGGLAGTREAMRFVHDELGPETYVNVMSQYRPCHEVHGDPVMGRALDPAEHGEAVAMARQAGLKRLDGPARGPRILLTW
jgi:putative pyruvate formate lyase activating enzyme